MKTDQEITSAYVPLFDRFANMTRLTNDPPLLAHYTSIPVMESILRDETVWFSNPLFMNDVEEMRFGIFEGSRLFSEPERLQSAADSSERAIKLESMFQHFRTKFENEDAFDTYIFCVAEHDRKNFDGLLSMWRGYGVHGNGAALVLDPSRVTLVPGSPFILATVSYAPTEQRLQELQELLDQWGKLTKSLELPDDKLYIASYMAFQIIKTYALTTKHSGFSEEQEWRVVYQRDRDQDGLLKNNLGYHIGPRGVEPKLKWKIGPIPNVAGEGFSLLNILDRIILGPSLSHPLAKKSIERMLEKIGKPELKAKLWASTIPLRPQN